jgi:NAD(P)-dependent dehydrogenase (short-subunit alcohol dehydrogenase family)
LYVYVVLITGPSPESLGAAIAKSLCTNCTPALLLLLGRSEPGALVKSLMDLNPAVKAIFIPCDLASLSSVRAAADRVIAVTSKIHVIINSAGIMAPPIFTKSADGIEMQFATNHVGPFLLTELLVGRLIAAGEEEGARVVNLTSTGHLISDIRYEDLNFEVSKRQGWGYTGVLITEDGAVYNPWSAYGQSKTANILYALSLAQKLAKYRIQAYSVHPGREYSMLNARKLLRRLICDNRLSYAAPEAYDRGKCFSGLCTHLQAR